MNKDSFIKKAVSFSNTDYIKLKDGINTVRIVSMPEDPEPYRIAFRHFLPREYSSENFTAAPLCLGGLQNCPGCQLIEQLRAQGKDVEADKAKAQKRYILTAFSREQPNNDAGELVIKFLEVPPSVFNGMATVLKDWDEDFTHVTTGYDLQIIRSSNGPMVKYDVKPVTKKEAGSMALVFTPLSEKEAMLVDEAYPDLDKEVELPDFASFAAAVGLGLTTEPIMNIGTPAPVAGTPAPVAGTPVPTTGTPVPTTGTPAPVAETPADTCPVYGKDYDESIDVCRACSVAEACKTETEAKTVNRRSV